MNKFALIIITICCFCITKAQAQASNTIYIIGHRMSFEHSAEKQLISEFYLLKRTTDAQGNHIIPINLPVTNPLREQFTQLLFNRSLSGLKEYWDRMSFRGIRPPIIQPSEQAILRFVSKVPGAIGYVSNKPKADNVVILGTLP